MSRPKGIKEMNPRKRMVARGTQDGQSYCREDSGCSRASNFLNEQSLCLECPFDRCKEEGK